MRFCTRAFVFVALVSTITGASEGQQKDSPPPYTYTRLGNEQNAVVKTMPGVALFGGRWVPDEAWRWMCSKSGGGDFLILTAYEDDSLPAAMVGSVCDVNSIATLDIPSREAANEPFVSSKIREAHAIFISGGAQGNYIHFWTGTAVQEALNDAIRRNIPIAGVSAGLAILGQFIFTAIPDTTSSDEVLKDPYSRNVNIGHDFLRIPLLKDTITDTHFVARDRLGRLLGFMARIEKDGMSREARGIGVDEQTAVLIESSGEARVVGSGDGSYFLNLSERPSICEAGKRLSLHNVVVQRVRPGGYFDLLNWSAPGERSYKLSVDQGVIRTEAPAGY